VCPALERALTGWSPRAPLSADPVVDMECPPVQDEKLRLSQPKLALPQPRSHWSGPLVEPSAPLPMPSPTSSCWSPWQRVSVGLGAPHAVLAQGRTAGLREPPDYRKPVDPWEPTLPPGCRAAQYPAAEHRESESPRGAGSARTPVRPPTLPCSHGRRGRGCFDAG
jgi:hypothetical protein